MTDPKQQPLPMGYHAVPDAMITTPAGNPIAQPRFITADGTGHLMTVAPTGSGKGRSVLIPQLLAYTGPVVVLDNKGENVAVTYRRRIEMGHKVVVFDPFQISTFDKAGINPLDIAHFTGADAEGECYSLAHLMAGRGSLEDPFWDNGAKGVISATLMYLILLRTAGEQNLGKLRSILSEDPAYHLAVVLDTEGKKLPSTVYDAIAGYLNLPSEKTRPSVDATALSYLTFMSGNIAKMLEKTTFDMQDFVNGREVDVFIVVPPDKLRSHSKLMVLIISTLFKAILSRREIPVQKTLFLLDETASLQSFEYLETMISLCRGYGALIHTFWQDISQIRKCYGEGYFSIINNCSVWQIFGIQHYTIAKELSEITGISAYELRNMKPNEQMLIINGREYKKAIKLDYLKDPYFAGKFDPNPFFKLNKTL
ncbi:type IV secretory system conjugative DNA transfer family protein [Dyadobacter diqingensis]|uniref:type IV secretory system conjugative DNA transfer family protein n=1 Tax=Dyadobacter diqingensis TaxID=2938121 RepID=UPI0020C1B187|nr:type IV secretory system conjugative DNA transfer family protein [Dyadobacter diqingensis]